MINAPVRNSPVSMTIKRIGDPMTSGTIAALMVLLYAWDASCTSTQIDMAMLWYSPLALGLIGILVISLLAGLISTLMRIRETHVPYDHTEEIPLTDIEKLKKLIREMGLKPHMDGDTLTARKGILSVIPSIVMRAGLVLFLCSLALSAYSREVSLDILSSTAAESTMFRQAVRLMDLKPGLPEDYLHIAGAGLLRLEGISAELDIDGTRVMLKDGSAVSHGGTYYRIVHMGYSLPITWDNNSRTTRLNLLPPGSTQNLNQFEHIPAIISLAPERAIKKGLLSGDIYNLRSPGFRIKLIETEQEIILKPGERDKGITLGEVTPYVGIEAVNDPALPFASIGLWLSVAGALLMLIRPFWFERRMSISISETHSTISYAQELYPLWGVYRLKHLIEPSEK
ncbi:hypothetical protein ACFLZI_01695 [Nitrospirota bacterium]